MIYFPETINTINTMSSTHLYTFFLNYACELTLCTLASWSHEGVVFLDFLPSPHFVTSFLFPCLGSTDALCSRLGDPVPLPPRWRPYSQGPRTLPYRDPEQIQWKSFFSIVGYNGRGFFLLWGTMEKIIQRRMIFLNLSASHYLQIKILEKLPTWTVKPIRGKN